MIPDVSLGTHFFNDLVEQDMLYLACFPGKTGNSIDHEWLINAPSQTERMLGKADPMSAVTRCIDTSSYQLVLHADPHYQHAALRFPG